MCDFWDIDTDASLKSVHATRHIPWKRGKKLIFMEASNARDECRAGKDTLPSSKVVYRRNTSLVPPCYSPTNKKSLKSQD